VWGLVMLKSRAPPNDRGMESHRARLRARRCRNRCQPVRSDPGKTLSRKSHASPFSDGSITRRSSRVFSRRSGRPCLGLRGGWPAPDCPDRCARRGPKPAVIGNGLVPAGPRGGTDRCLLYASTNDVHPIGERRPGLTEPFESPTERDRARLLRAGPPGGRRQAAIHVRTVAGPAPAFRKTGLPVGIVPVHRGRGGSFSGTPDSLDDPCCACIVEGAPPPMSPIVKSRTLANWMSAIPPLTTLPARGHLNAFSSKFRTLDHGLAIVACSGARCRDALDALFGFGCWATLPTATPATGRSTGPGAQRYPHLQDLFRKTGSGRSRPLLCDGVLAHPVRVGSVDRVRTSPAITVLSGPSTPRVTAQRHLTPSVTDGPAGRRSSVLSAARRNERKAAYRGPGSRTCLTPRAPWVRDLAERRSRTGSIGRDPTRRPGVTRPRRSCLPPVRLWAGSSRSTSVVGTGFIPFPRLTFQATLPGPRRSWWTVVEDPDAPAAPPVPNEKVPLSISAEFRAGMPCRDAASGEVAESPWPARPSPPLG